MSTNKTTPARLQPVEGQESTTTNRKKITMSVTTPNAKGNDVEGWPVPAPSWATRIEVTPLELSLGLERTAVFGSGPLEPWSACVERTDVHELGEAIEESPLGIRLTTAPTDADEDMHTPQEARSMAHSLLRAAALLERLQVAQESADKLDGVSGETLTSCPSWCDPSLHGVDVAPDGTEQCVHAGTPVETGAGHSAWVQRIDSRSSDGTITLGPIGVGVDLDHGPNLEPETAGAIAAMLFTLGMQVKRLREAAAAADSERDE